MFTLTNNNTIRPLPQAPGVPVLGCLPALVANPYGFLAHAHRVCGDIYHMDLGALGVVVLTHPRHAQHVLVDHADNYGKGGGMWNTARAMFGNGLVVSEGAFWLRQRRMMQPQFHRQKLVDLTTLMVRAIDESLATWSETPHQGSVDLSPLLSQLTMRVTTRALFGEGLSPDDMREVAQALAYAVDYILRAVVVDALPDWLPVPGRGRFAQQGALIDKHVYAIIAAARSKQRTDQHLLAMLLDAVDVDSGEGMTDRQLRDEVTTLFLAGYETAAVGLAWAFELLGHHPELQQRLQTEVDAVLQGRLPTFADLARLPYARMVFQETLRLYPPAWQLPRLALEDDVIDGYVIAKGTTVITSIHSIQRHPAEWPEPERFDPERFAPDRARRRHKLAFMPFGAGQRQCIGRDFALVEGPLALSMIAQRFHVLPTRSTSAEPRLSTTLRPKQGVHVRLVARAGMRPADHSGI